MLFGVFGNFVSREISPKELELKSTFDNQRLSEKLNIFAYNKNMKYLNLNIFGPLSYFQFWCLHLKFFNQNRLFDF